MYSMRQKKQNKFLRLLIAEVDIRDGYMRFSIAFDTSNVVMYVYVCMCICIYMCLYICVYKCVCACVYMYICVSLPRLR